MTDPIFETCCSSENNSPTLNGALYSSANNVAFDTQKEAMDHLFLSCEPLKSSQYYATGAVAYCSHEPCVMCAMALLHNRVAAVVFPQKNENKDYGGLGSRVSLHVNKQLNHRFRVLRVNLATL